MHDKKQYVQNLMGPLMHILFVSLLLSILHQIESYAQVNEHAVMSQTFFMSVQYENFLTMCLFTMRTGICSKIKNNRDGCGTFNGITYLINALIKSLTWILFLHAITFVFERLNSQLDKLNEFEYTYGNTSNIGIIENIHGTSITATFCLAAIYLTMQFMNESASNIVVSTKCNLKYCCKGSIGFKFTSLCTNRFSHLHVIRNVCDAQCFLFHFLNFFVYEL